MYIYIILQANLKMFPLFLCNDYLGPKGYDAVVEVIYSSGERGLPGKVGERGEPGELGPKGLRGPKGTTPQTQ